jgi:hypothetical protein
VVAGLSFPGVLPMERRARGYAWVRGGRQWASLSHGAGGGGHRSGRCGRRRLMWRLEGAWHWRHAEQPPDGVSAAQALLSSGVVAESGRGWLDRWTEGLGDQRCARVPNPSCVLSPPVVRFSFGPRATSSPVLAGDPRSGDRLWSYAGSAFGGGAVRDTSATSMSL